MAEATGPHSMTFDHFEQELHSVEQLLSQHQPDGTGLSRSRKQQIIRDLNERRGLTLESNFAMRRANSTFSPDVVRQQRQEPAAAEQAAGQDRRAGGEAGAAGASKPNRPATQESRAADQPPHQRADQPAERTSTAHVSSANRYHSREDREQLVQRLLREREERLRAKMTGRPAPGGSAAASTSTARSAPATAATEALSAPRAEAAVALAARASSPAARPAGAAGGPEEYDASRHSLASAGAAAGRGASPSGGASRRPPSAPAAAAAPQRGAGQARGDAPARAAPARRTRTASAPRARPQTSAARPDGKVEAGAAGARSKRASRDDSALDREQRELSECTFKPQINRRSGGGGGPSARLEELAQSRRDQYEARERERTLAQRQRELAECTFKPRLVARKKQRAAQRRPGTGASGRSAAGRGGGGGGEKKGGARVQDRLHEDAKQREVARAQAAAEAKRLETEGHSFRPSINPGSDAWLDADRYRPIHERVNELQREKQFRLQQRRMEAELADEDLTFAPRINQRSSVADSSRSQRDGGAELGDDGGDAWSAGGLETESATGGGSSRAAQRLTEDAARRMERQLLKQKQYAEQMERDCRFEPSINTRSRQIADTLPHFQGPGRNFVDRQQLMHESTGERLRQRSLRQVAEEREATCTFQPAIGNADEVLAQSKPGRLYESSDERYRRLSKEEYDRAERRRKAAAAQAQSQFSFEPRINDRSKRMAPQSSIDDLVNDTRRKRAQLRATSLAEEDFRRSHTFRPQLSASRHRSEEEGGDGEVAEGSRFRIDFSNAECITERIQQHHAAQEAKRDWARRMAEYKELQGCTFAPQISEAPPQEEGPVVVRGLGRYLELREMAKQREEEQRLRAQNAFRVRGSSSHRDVRGHTRAQPFKLQTEARASTNSRRSTAAEELEVRQMGECTFKPQTMEGVNRKAIREILAE